MKRILILTLISVTLFPSCRFINQDHVRGDGSVTTQTRKVSDFKGVDVSGAIEVYLKQDPAFSVKLETDNNLMEFIEVYNEGDVLHIHPRNNANLDPSHKIIAYVSAPSFYKINASGACNVFTENMVGNETRLEIDLSGASGVKLDVKAPTVGVDASGASSVELSGETKDLSIGGSGSTDVKAFGLKSENARIDLSGASNVDVFASVKLDAKASGASSIHYKGNASINSDISGAGSIKKAD